MREGPQYYIVVAACGFVAVLLQTRVLQADHDTKPDAGTAIQRLWYLLVVIYLMVSGNLSLLYCELGPALGLKSCYAQLELPSTIMDHVPRARQYKSGNVHLLHLVKSLCSNCRLRCLLSLLNRFLSSYDWHRDTNATAIMTSTALGICPYI